MRIQSIEKHPGHVVLIAEGRRLRLEVISDHIIRVVCTGRDTFNNQQSLMMLDRPSLASAPVPNVSESDKTITLSTPAIKLHIDRASGAFTWQDGAGNLLVREPNDGAESKVLSEIEVKKAVYEKGKTLIKQVTTADGVKSVAEPAQVVVDRKAYSTKVRLEFSEGEAIYGLGQHEEGVLNYRGKHQYIYQQNMKIAAPIIVSTRGYAMLWDTYSLATFQDDQHGTWFWTEVDDEMDFYFIAGPEFDTIMSRIRSLTGRVPMMPRWSLGYFQSKERYRTQDELVSIVKEFRDRKIPIDCIVLDWLSWTGELWGQKSFDPGRFPDPKKLCDDIHSMDAKFMVSIWPVMRKECANQVEMRSHGWLLGNDATYNVFEPEALKLYWKQANEGYFQYGVDAWWADCTEPFEGDWKGDVKPEPWNRVRINTDEQKKYLDPEYINAYSLLHTGGLYRGQRAISDKRSVVLTRSAYIGQQRYGAVTWSGDVTATWSTLRKQIADGLNFCMTGNPRWTFDVGAFFVGQKQQWFWRGDYPKGCEDEGYRELYTRWLQLGAFLPMFRSHGTDTPREPWRFGDKGNANYETILKFIRLRYRLLPYLYSLMGWETLYDYTMMRALAFDFRHDPKVYDIADQFMLGPALMVCPITHPMYYGPDSTLLQGTKKSRSVYLPAGSDWYDFWTNKKFKGGQTIEVEAPLETMPLFVKSGSILPLGPEVEYSEQAPDAPWEIRVYPGADAKFSLYEDAGDGYAYEKGEYAITELEWSEANQKLAVGKPSGRFARMVENRDYIVKTV